MTKKYKILAQFIKDMSSETPDIDTFIFVKDNIANYSLDIDIKSKAVKDKIIQVETTLGYSDKSNNNKKKSFFEMIYVTMVRLDDDVNEKNDLAILILENAESMPFLALREDEAVEVGELVLAIGNPFGVGQTVTSGIISGLARSGTADGSGRGYYLQTDAAINPGNSGGALVDINGSLVGINTSILTRSGGSNGIGFAIPAAFVREFLRQAKSGVKKFEQPWLGVFGQAITPELAEALQLDGFDGMVISALHEKSPLMLAGLSKGDVVVSVDNFAVNGPAEMLFRLTVAGIGSQSKLSIVSGGQRRDLWIELKPAPNDPPSNLKRLPKTSPLRDLIVRIINPAVQQEMGLGLSTRGIVVVEPGPIGSRLGFRSGDIIEEINGTRLISAEQIDELIGTSNRSGQFIISRDGQRLTIRYRT